MERAEGDARRDAKGRRNRRAYEKLKARGDHVLLRLDRGGAAPLDAAARAAGLSRAAFCRMFLPALAEAAGSRLPALDAARAATGESLARFIGRALDEAAARASGSAELAASAAAEFDSLFGEGPC